MTKQELLEEELQLKFEESILQRTIDGVHDQLDALEIASELANIAGKKEEYTHVFNYQSVLELHSNRVFNVLERLIPESQSLRLFSYGSTEMRGYGRTDQYYRTICFMLGENLFLEVFLREVKKPHKEEAYHLFMEPHKTQEPIILQCEDGRLNIADQDGPILEHPFNRGKYISYNGLEMGEAIGYLDIDSVIHELEEEYHVELPEPNKTNTK